MQRSLFHLRILAAIRSSFLVFGVGSGLLCAAFTYGKAGGDKSTSRLESFEVASVRTVQPKERGLFSISPPGATTFIVRNARLSLLIALAFGIDSSNQIAGKPSWLETEQYDITAKIEGNVGLSYEELRPLLQRLLQDRFHFRYHPVTETYHGYALIIGKRGPTLLSSQSKDPSAFIIKNGLRIHAGTVGLLASMLSQVLRSPVVDKTGIKGNFDIELNFAGDDVSDTSLPSVFTEVQEKLGLKLVKDEVPVDLLVIDHVDRNPTEN